MRLKEGVCKDHVWSELRGCAVAAVAAVVAVVAVVAEASVETRSRT